MAMSRRTLMSVTPSIMLAPVLARAGETTTDLAVTCDSAVAPAVIAAGVAFRRRSGVRVRVFPTQPGLILPQLQREIQNDIIVTAVATIDGAERSGLVAAGGRVGPWRNRLAIVETINPMAPEGTIAVPDFTPSIGIDGPAILERMGLSAGKVDGVLDTGTVWWALREQKVRRGLLYQTEVAEDHRINADDNAPDRLRVVAAVPDADWPPVIYQAVVTKLARRGDPVAFLAFLGSADGQAVLSKAGLESVT